MIEEGILDSVCDLLIGIRGNTSLPDSVPTTPLKDFTASPSLKPRTNFKRPSIFSTEFEQSKKKEATEGITTESGKQNQKTEINEKIENGNGNESNSETENNNEINQNGVDKNEIEGNQIEDNVSKETELTPPPSPTQLIDPNKPELLKEDLGEEEKSLGESFQLIDDKPDTPFSPSKLIFNEENEENEEQVTSEPEVDSETSQNMASDLSIRTTSILTTQEEGFDYDDELDQSHLFQHPLVDEVLTAKMEADVISFLKGKTFIFYYYFKQNKKWKKKKKRNCCLWLQN